jgi:PKD repeat protein
LVNSSEWSLKDIDLTAYAGQRVRLAFFHVARCYYSGCGDTGHGWFIDDIDISSTGATNHPPELALISDQSVNESDTLTIPLSATDPNLADTLSYSVSAPDFVALTDNGDWTAELVATPSLTDAGAHTITVTVTDLGGLSDSQIFTLTVNDAPQAPSLQPIADQSMNEGETLLVPLAASDPDAGDALTLSMSGPAFVTLTDNGDGTGSLSLVPGFEDAGAYTVTVTAEDSTALSVSRVFALTVNDLPPPMAVVAPQTIDFGDVVIGSTANESVLLSNTGGSTLHVTDLVGSGAPFVVYPPANFELAAGAERSLPVGFAPTAEGEFSGTFTIENNSGAVVTVTLSGRGVHPPEPGKIEMTDYLDFGTVAETQTLQKVLTISNTGEGPLTLTSAASDSVVFQVTTTAGDLLPYTLNPGESRNLLLSFAPPADSAGSRYSGNLEIVSDDPDRPSVSVALEGKAVSLSDEVENNPVLDAHVLEGSVADLITAASCAGVGGEVTLSSEAGSADSFVVRLVDQGGVTAVSAPVTASDGASGVGFSGIDACALADGVISLQVVYTTGGTELPAVPGTPAVKNTTALDPPVLDPLDPYSLSPVIEVCGTSRPDTTVRIEGGARVASTRLDASTSNFCLPVTLRQNMENILIASAIDELAPTPKPVASAKPMKVVHVDPSQIVIAEAYSRPLTVEEIDELVARGVIDTHEAENFHVSMFTVVFTIGSHAVTISQPVVHNPTPGSVSYGRGAPGPSGSGGHGWVGGVTGGSGGVSAGGGCRSACAQVVVITTPTGQTIPGVIIIDGRIKTLKEFFQVTLLLHNVSSNFVLSEMTATIQVPDALTTIAAGLGTDPLEVDPEGSAETLQLGEILPGATGAGQFVVRGDAVGIHAIDIHFDGEITGGGLPLSIPVSGVASTSVEVLGPPQLSVVVRHPSRVDGPDVTLNEIYDLIVEITNESDRPALYTSLELFVGGDALLVDTSDQPVPTSSQIVDFGLIQPGDTVTAGFRVQSLVEGEIIACQAIAAENILLTVDTGPDGAACNILNTYPASFVPLDPDHAPVVLAVNPEHQQTNIPITSSVVAVFTPQTSCLIADTWDNVVTAPIDPNDPGKGVQVVSATLVQAGNYYLEELSATGDPVRHIPTDLSVEHPPAGGTTIAVLRLGLDSPHPNSQYFLKPDTTYRATLLGGNNGVCSLASGKTMENAYSWIFHTGASAGSNPPSMNPIGDQTVAEGASLQLDFSATDLDQDALSFSLNGPAFVSLQDNGDGTGRLTFTPGYTDAGVYSLTLTVSDSVGLSDSATFTLTVQNSNRAPVLAAIADQVMDEGATLTLTLSASDPDVGDSLSLSIVAPSFVTLTDNGDGGGQLQLAPDFDSAGTYTVTVTASDAGGLSDSQSFTLSVNNSNRPPVLASIGDKGVDEGMVLSFALSASDPDGDVLALSAMGLPAGANLVDHGDGTGQFSWTPSATQAGLYTVEFLVTDNGTPQAVDSEQITITVANVNHAPVLDAVGDRTVEEQVELSLLLTASDSDGDGLSFAVANLPTGAQLTDNGDGSALFSWTPSFAQAGNYQVRFIVTDDGSPAASDSEEITITVGDVNRPPVLDAIGNHQVNEGESLSFDLSAFDPDDNQLSFSAGNLPLDAVLTDNGDGTADLSWTPGYGDAGNYTVNFIVTDDGVPAASDREEITITVGDVNRPPVLGAIGNRLLNEGEAFSIILSANDPDGNSLAFTANNLPDGSSLTDQGNGTALFSWTPAYTQAGNHSVEFVVTDDGVPVASDSEEVILTVGDVNRPPSLDSIGERRVKEGESLSFVITANDPDGDTLTISADTLPSGAILIDNGDGTAHFDWLPTIGQAGTYPIGFTVSDSGAPSMSDSEEVSVIVETAGGCEEMVGDIDRDCDVDQDDMNIIMAARNTPAEGADDPRDLDGDGTITANDARQLALLCTRPRCATQ